MSVLLKKILWYRSSNPSVPINITDAIVMSTSRGLSIQNNVVTFNLKNNTDRFNASGDLLTKYVDDSGVSKFEYRDQLKIYLHYSDDFAEIESSAWGSDPTQVPSNDYLRGTFYVVDVGGKQESKSNVVACKTADKGFILLGRLLASAFILDDTITTPEIIQKVIRFSTQNVDGEYLGTGGDSGVRYDVQANLESESGFIQDERKATKEDGSVNAATTFPDVAMGKIWKPVYEWIDELSQLEYLNTSAELESVLVYGRPFISWIDELNRFHWVETDDVVTDTFVVGTTEGIRSYDVNKGVFDVNNFIVFRGGEDFYGNGTLDYYIDPTTNVRDKRMRVVAMTDIAKNLIQKEIDNGNLVLNAAGTFTFSGNRYNRNGNVTPHWSSDTETTDSDYNTSLRTEILKRGKNRARNIVRGLSSARLKGNISLKGQIVTVGSLINLTNKRCGHVNELIRIMNVRDNITKEGWFTTIDLEQDGLAIVEASS